MRLNGLMNSVSFAPLWAPEGVADGGGAGEGAGAGEAQAAETVLFPDDNKAAAAADGDKGGDAAAAAAKEGEGDKGEGDKGAADWKEYENDPSKTPEENAALKAEHDKTKPAAGDDTTVPEAYDLKMPEGVPLDDKLLEAVTPVFKDLFLTNAQAQALTDKFTEVMQQRVTAQGENWANTISGWADQAKADKDIGGDNWDATVSTGLRAVNILGTPELRDYLNASGGGNHPEVIRFMAKVGAMIKEDSPAVGGAEGKGKPVDPAHIIFANDAPKG